MSEKNLKIKCHSCGNEIVKDVYHRLRSGKVLCRSCFDREIETPRFLFELKELIKSKSFNELSSSSRAVFLVDYLKGKIAEEEIVFQEASGRAINFSQVYEMVKGKAI